MNDLITTTRATVKRGWTEFEPKVITGLLSGSVGAAIVSLLVSFGFTVDETIRNFIIVGCYFLGSYLTPSSGMVITTKSGGGEVVTKTTGHTVTTATNSIPVQPAPETPHQPGAGKYDHILGNLGNMAGDADNQATRVLNGPMIGDGSTGSEYR